MELPPWQRRASRYIVHDRWIAVRADHCVSAAGVEIAPYYILEYPDWVQIVALDTADNVVMVRQYRHGIGKTSVELPAGRVDAEDGTPLVTAARELLEETGYASAEPLQLLATLSPNTATHANRTHTVLARNVTRVAEPKPDPTEAIVVELVPRAEALRRALAGEVMQSMHVASLVIGLKAAGAETQGR
jgi:8-oxo-dGTP pyrophosphatase MutT (NUDIX family)